MSWMYGTKHVWVVLLALQFGLQPLLAREFLPAQQSKAVTALVVELVKLCIAVCLAGPQQNQGVMPPLLPRSKGSARRLVAVILPSLTYALQNTCLHHAYAELDGVTFNCLNQLKIVFSALFVYLVNGVKQSAQQVLALALLLLAGFLVQLQQSGTRSVALMHHLTHSSRGVLFALLTSLLSGLASSLTQLATQRYRIGAYALTGQMACLQVPMLLMRALHENDFLLHPLIGHWNVFSFIPVVAQAVGGIIVGKVMEELGAVSKAFGVVAGLVLTGCAESCYRKQPLELLQLVALVLVGLATLLYNTASKAKALKDKRKGSSFRSSILPLHEHRYDIKKK